MCFVVCTQGLPPGEVAVVVGRKGPALAVSPEALSLVLPLSSAFLSLCQKKHEEPCGVRSVLLLVYALSFELSSQ